MIIPALAMVLLLESPASGVEITGWDSFSSPDGLVDERIRQVLEEPDGTLLALTVNSGLFRFDGRHFIPHPVNRLLYNLFIQNALYDQRGLLWLACNYEGIWWYKDGLATPAPFNDLFHQEHFKLLYQDDRGRIWIAVNRAGLFLYDGQECRLVSADYGLPYQDIGQIQYHQGALYLLFENGGIYTIHPDQPGHAGEWLVKKSDLVRFLVTDSGMRYEINTSGSLLAVQGEKNRLLNHQQLLMDPASDILQDHQGTIWFSIDDSLAAYEPQQDRITLFPVNNPGRLYQDRFRQLWLASRQGLARTQIISRRRFPLPGPLTLQSSQLVSFRSNRFMFAADNGRLYTLDSQGRPLEFKEGRVSFTAWPDTLPGRQLTAVAQDRRGDFWLAAWPSSLYRWDGTRLTQPIPRAQLPAPYITTLYPDAGGGLWISGLSHESVWGSSRAELLITRERARRGSWQDSYPLTCLMVDSASEVWCSDRSGTIYHTNGTSLNATRIANGFSELHAVRSLTKAGAALWGMADDALFRLIPAATGDFNFERFDPGQELQLPASFATHLPTGRFTRPHLLKLAFRHAGQNPEWHEKLYNLSDWVTADSTLWIATTSTGLYAWRNGALRPYRQTEGLPSLQISRLLLTQEGRLFAATLDRGLYLLRDGRFQPLLHDPSFNTITALWQSPDRSIWLGSAAGEVMQLGGDQTPRGRWQLGPGPVYGFASLEGRKVAAALAQGSFAVIDSLPAARFSLQEMLRTPWLRRQLKGFMVNYPQAWKEPQLKYSRGLGRWDGLTLRLYTAADGLTSHEIVDITEDRQGQLFVAACNTGIMRYQEGRFIAATDSLLDRMSGFIRLGAAADTSIWALTADQGAARCKQGRWHVWGTESPLITYKMLDFAPDTCGRMIFHDNAGFYFFQDGRITRIRPESGLQPQSTFAPCFHIDAANRLWYLEGDSALVAEPIDDQPPLIKINQVQIGARLYSSEEYPQPLTAGYRDNACVIDFFAYHPHFPTDRLQYSYRILQEGAASEWQSLAIPRLFLSRLESGRRYILELRVQTPNARFSPSVRLALQLAAQPVYLRSWFAPTLAAISLAALAAWLYWRYFHMQRLLLRRRYNPYVAGEPVLNRALFFGREEILGKILSIIHNNSVLVLGERRIGKTSLLKQLALRLQERDPAWKFVPVYVDLQGVEEKEFFAAMMQDIIDQSGAATGRLALQLQNRVAEYGYRAFTADLRTITAALADGEKKRLKLVLLIDEADTMNQYDQSLHAQLRRIFMQDVSVHFAAVITGTHFIREWNRPESPWWNLFTLMELAAISETAARELIQKPVQSLFSYDPAAVTAIVALTDCKPYAIQMLCLHLIDRMLDLQRRIIHAEDVAQAAADYPQLFQNRSSAS